MKLTINRFLAGILCILLSPLPSVTQATGQHAGQISALIPAASHNSRPAQVKDDLQWNDELKTEHTGRLRASLADGSILTLGSDSDLRVVQHDAASQQTSLEMNFGKLRSEVVKITKPGGKFEVKTPNAVIGVIGTKFYVGYQGNKTTVICYVGQVTVTALGAAVAGGAAGGSVTVNAGQMVEITDAPPPGGLQSLTTPTEVQQATIGDTNLNSAAPVGAAHAGISPILIGAGMAAGLAVGIALGSRDNGNGPTMPTCLPSTSQTMCKGTAPTFRR